MREHDRLKLGISKAIITRKDIQNRSLGGQQEETRRNIGKYLSSFTAEYLIEDP